MSKILLPEYVGPRRSEKSSLVKCYFTNPVAKKQSLDMYSSGVFFLLCLIFYEDKSNTRLTGHISSIVMLNNLVFSVVKNSWIHVCQSCCVASVKE